MKLTELRSGIRKMKGNPSIVVELTPGVPMTLVLQKTPTLEALGLAYGSTKDDIGLTLDETSGIISGPTNHQAVFYADLVANGSPVGNCPDLDEAMALDLEDDEDML